MVDVRTRTTWIVVLVLALSGSSLMAACSSSSHPAGSNSTTTIAAAPRELRIAAVDDKLMLPAIAPAGITDVVMHNRGDETHQVDIVRMEPGKTKNDLLGAVAKLDPTGV